MKVFVSSVLEKLKRIQNRRAEARMQKLLFRPMPNLLMGNLRPIKITTALDAARTRRRRI
jgi:hypothetical protein